MMDEVKALERMRVIREEIGKLNGKISLLHAEYVRLWKEELPRVFCRVCGNRVAGKYDHFDEVWGWKCVV